MATTSAAAAALSMKLLIDRKAQRVLFAEASKEVVDFLFSLLALPLATAVKLVGKESMVGSVGSLYARVDKLDSTYLQAGAAKDAVLCPVAGSKLQQLSASGAVPAAAPALQNASRGPGKNKGKKKKKKKKKDASAGEVKNASAGKKKKKASAGISGGTTKGFVQGIVTYMVLDDLTVSAISSITLLNTFAVRDLGDLHEKTVQLGYNEGLAILKASLQSKSVLTDVFVHGNNKAPGPGGRA